MTVANLVGIPVGTYLSCEFSWRVHLLLDRGFQHRCAHRNFLLGAGYHDKARAQQFHFCAVPRRLIFAATMCSARGRFCPFSYIKPFMMYIPVFETSMTFIMMLVGWDGVKVICWAANSPADIPAAHRGSD